MIKGFFKLYPNPLANTLYMLSEIPLSSLTYFIHNTLGQKVLENQMFNLSASTEISLNIPLLPPGDYVITLLSTDQASTFRLIKE
jgi:hypothetical protein